LQRPNAAVRPQTVGTRGYVCEDYGASFRLPELGPIGSNGLANARDFETPGGRTRSRNGRGRSDPQVRRQALAQQSSGHGNLAPFKYDTARFMAIGTVSYDHPDPSIFTVLTSPSETPGTANCDFVVFPPRWMVAGDTLRPPRHHRNVMSEFMGLVKGQYDAKPEGFKPGGASLHNSMVPHGLDAEAFEKASNAKLAPAKLDNTLAFMFESRWRFVPTTFPMQGGALDKDYARCWDELRDRFTS